MTIQIVGKMQDGRPIIFGKSVNKPVEPNDILLNEDGEYLRVIGGGQRLQTAVLPEVRNPKDYQDTIDSFLMDTGRM